MVTSTRDRHPRHAAACALMLGALLLPLTGCGEEGRPGSAAGTSDDVPPSKPSTAAASPSASTGASTGASPGASPYVEPGVVDGAPHHGENNAHRRPGAMSAADERAAEAEAARLRPVLKRLHARGTWDPESVRTTLTAELGYEPRGTDGPGAPSGGTLEVREMYGRYEEKRYVTPEGALIGLYVGDGACVTGYTQKTGFGVRTNGRFMESGCLEPLTGH
ncbi:Lipoprotein OS=Streptomyces alboniger OX=132473 GN=CP975_15085 PE=4 SV=1 [Streptomyces alboniger]